MSSIEKKRGATSYLSGWFWWIIAIFFLFIAVCFALISAAGFEGFFGTTGIRRATDAEISLKLKSELTEEDILGLREPGSGTSSKNPIAYLSKTDIPQKSNSLYNVDRRLARLFNYYLANENVTDPSIKPFAHDFIEIKTTDSKYSSLSMPPENQPSVSTLYRGVGVRITGLDKIKCSYKRACDTPGCNLSCPAEWTKYKQYPILFSQDGIESTTKAANEDLTAIPGCLTQCAVDYYPYVENRISDKSVNAKRQPSETTLDKFSSLADDSADYKLASIVTELLSTDDQIGSKPSYKGSAKLTPFSIIVPQNLKSLLEKTGEWDDLIKKADSAYFLPLQKKSGLAGLCFDMYLNGKEGLVRAIHINY